MIGDEILVRFMMWIALNVFIIPDYYFFMKYFSKQMFKMDLWILIQLQEWITNLA